MNEILTGRDCGDEDDTPPICSACHGTKLVWVRELDAIASCPFCTEIYGSSMN